MLLLDTDAISLIQRGSGTRYAALSRLLDEDNDDVFVSIISVDEQIHGAFGEIANNNPLVRVRGYHRLRELIADYCDRPMLEYDEKAELVFGRLKGLKGRPGTKDLRIAAIALSHDAILITGNAKDFEKIPFLKLRVIPP